MNILTLLLLLGSYVNQLRPNKIEVNAETPVLQTINFNDTQCQQEANYQIVHLFTLMTKKNRLLDRSLHTNSFIHAMVSLLLAISNDVQLNPGPPNNESTIYPCGTCDQPVTWDHRAVVCDTCDQWYHISCQEIHSGTYSILNEDENIRWDCIVCNNPNYSSTCFDLHHIATHNSFSALTISDTSLQSPNSQNIRPVHASTPVKKTHFKTDPKQAPLRILNINCQSIKKKQDRVENIVESTRPDIVIATETWLDSTITNNQVFPSNYTVWRKDRDTGKGGGVLIAVHNNYLSSDVPELQTDCEIIWAKVNIVNSKALYICSYYNPKTSDENSLRKFGESINRAANINDAALIIGGDFNLPGWDWKTNTIKSNTQHAKNHYQLADILDDNGLKQLIEEPTRNKNTLDLLMTNIPSKVTRTDVIPGISDHDAVYAEFDIKPAKHKQVPRKIPLYKNARWDSMKTDMLTLHNTVKQEAEDGSDINRLWDIFTSSLQNSAFKHIPQKQAKSNDRLPWITKEIKQLIKKRDRLHKKKKKSNDNKDINKFKQLKQLVQKKIRQAYWSYTEGIISLDSESTQNCKTNSKRFWTYIKHKKKDNSSIPGIKDKGRLYTDAKHKATILNKQFQSVFSEALIINEKEFQENNTMKKKPSNKAPDITISVKGVQKLLENLNPFKAAGPDQIKPKILKELAKEIAPTLTIIFNISYNTGTIPDEWRTAIVQPIYKKGNKYDPSNYRPISLTCICCKLLEHIITSHIMNHGEKNNILYPLQHGFRKNRSCETQLLEFIDDVSKNLDNGKQTDILVMDFAKAFDKVSHSLLIHKLHHYGIQGKTNKWIQAFLSDRSQVVAMDGSISDAVSVESGVPQGSVVGPSLFLYYINDIQEELHSTVRLFADDTIAYLTITSNSDCKILQQDLDKLANWEAKWKMKFHPMKCQVLSVTRKKNPITFNYHLHGHALEHVNSAKYLGCTVNNTLDWGQHINNISTKANNTLGFLRRNLNIASTKTKEMAYKSMVRPTVEFASCVWDPHEIGDINKIEAVQRRGARFVKHKYHNRSSVTTMIEDLQWQTLETRRKEARLTMLYKIIHSEVAIKPDTYLQRPHRQSRITNSNSYAVPYTNTTSRQKSFFPRTIRDWNLLPPDIQSAGSVEVFKTRLAKHFI